LPSYANGVKPAKGAFHNNFYRSPNSRHGVFPLGGGLQCTQKIKMPSGSARIDAECWSAILQILQVNIYITRGSVCAGDDIDPPHEHSMVISDGTSVEDIISAIARSDYLPSISGGKATWSAASRVLLAVIAQEWTKPKMIDFLPVSMDKLDVVNDTLRIHFSYHAQEDPEKVFEILRNVRLTVR
jgi:hypothetical protein